MFMNRQNLKLKPNTVFGAIGYLLPASAVENSGQRSQQCICGAITRKSEGAIFEKQVLRGRFSQGHNVSIPLPACDSEIYVICGVKFS